MIAVIDAGHGGSDSGATGHGVVEATVNLGVAEALATLLRMQKHDVRMGPRNEPVVSVSDRGAWAAEQGADVFVSIHHDASDNASASGTHGFYHSEQAPAGKALATKLAEEVHAQFGVPFSYGEPASDWFGKTLGVLRGGGNWQVTGAACLVEMMFVSSDKDSQIIKSPGYYILAAHALARGIHRYAGLGVPAEWGTAEGPALPPTEFEVARKMLMDAGITDGSDPHGMVTREQFWAMEKRLLEKLGLTLK